MRSFAFYLTVFLVLIFHMGLDAQDRQVFRSTDAIIDVESYADPGLIFIDPAYIPAKVYFVDGRIEDAQMRYNILLDQMQFLSRRGEVMNLSLLPAFNRIEFDDRVFIHGREHGYLELLRDGHIRLFQKRRIRVEGQPVARGAYGMTDQTSAIDITENLHRGGRIITLDNHNRGEIEITLRYFSSFYILKEEKMIPIGSRRQFLREFSEHRSDLRNFISSNSIDFDEAADLIKLIDYLDGLLQQGQ